MQAAPTSPQTPPSQGGTGTQMMPQKPMQPSNPDTCQSLQNPQHVAIAKALTGNERTLFCSIFSDQQRDMVIEEMKKNKKMDPKTAVVQVAKQVGILDNKNPQGACGPK